MCLKICHCDTDIECNTVTRGHIYKLSKQPARINARNFCFVNRVFMPWNDLPAYVVESANMNILKKRLDSVNLQKYCKYILQT